MNLKPLENTAVHTPTKAEYDELMIIYQDAGWRWYSGLNPTNREFDSDLVYIFVQNIFGYASASEHKTITLNEFKQIQNIESEPQMEDIDKIMAEYGVLKPKYSAGDVLVNDSGNKRLVLGVQDYVLYLSDTDDFTGTDGYWTQRELDNRGLKLHTGTPEPTKTKFTMQEIADKIGMGVDSFEIVE